MISCTKYQTALLVYSHCCMLLRSFYSKTYGKLIHILSSLMRTVVLNVNVIVIVIVMLTIKYPSANKSTYESYLLLYQRWCLRISKKTTILTIFDRYCGIRIKNCGTSNGKVRWIRSMPLLLLLRLLLRPRILFYLQGATPRQNEEWILSRLWRKPLGVGIAIKHLQTRNYSINRNKQ